MSDQIGIRGSAKEKAEDLHNAKTVAFNTYTDELHALRCTALGRIESLAASTESVPVSDIQAVLGTLKARIAEAMTRYEAKVKLIEEAYK
jgi:hypothetical protein